MGGISMPSCALPPVVNDPGYRAPEPINANVPKPPSANTLYELMSRLDRLQSEVQQLTGKVEEQAYQNAELKKRLSTMYSDFDERMQNVENRLDGGKEPDAEAPASPESTGANQTESETPVEAEPAAESEQQPAEPSGQQPQEAAAAPEKQEAQPTPPEAEKQEYQQAYDALRNGRTTQSIEGFNAFLNKYPSSQLANNAQYWLGEAYRVNQDADSARKAFNSVIDKYPDSAKVPDALLKLGYVEFDLKNWAKAREYLTRVTTDFPTSKAAQLASKKLQLIDDVKP